jgi:hypothetical protein
MTSTRPHRAARILVGLLVWVAVIVALGPHLGDVELVALGVAVAIAVAVLAAPVGRGVRALTRHLRSAR